MRKSLLVLLSIVFAVALLNLYYYPQLPKLMPSHWNAAGEADAYMGKELALMIMPGIMLFLALLFHIMPIIDPLKKNIEGFRKYFDAFIILIFLFLAFINFLMIAWGLGEEWDIISAFSLWLAVIFFYAGFMVKKSKKNWSIGIRTPWAMLSDNIWEKTNRRGGQLFQVIGIAMLSGLLIGEWLFLVLVTLLAAAGVYITYYSYSEYQKEIKARKKNKQ
jgi:uncharacterized membrane protein